MSMSMVNDDTLPCRKISTGTVLYILYHVKSQAKKCDYIE